MLKHENLVGKEFGRLIVVGKLGSRWLCECSCGNTKMRSVGSHYLKSGRITACGCKGREAKTAHGFSGSKIYNVWHNMVYRCVSYKAVGYEHYGGRGITVCEKWLDVREFMLWAKDRYKEGLQLDRTDNNRGYSPDNCRFVTASENCRNRRLRSSSSAGD